MLSVQGQIERFDKTELLISTVKRNHLPYLYAGISYQKVFCARLCNRRYMSMKVTPAAGTETCYVC